MFWFILLIKKSSTRKNSRLSNHIKNLEQHFFKGSTIGNLKSFLFFSCKVQCPSYIDMIIHRYDLLKKIWRHSLTGDFKQSPTQNLKHLHRRVLRFWTQREQKYKHSRWIRRFPPTGFFSTATCSATLSRYLVEDLRWDGATMAVQVTSLKTHYFAIFQGTTWHFINYPLGSLLFQEYKHLLSVTDTYSRGNWNTIRVSDKYGQTLNMDNLSQGYVSQVYVKSTYLDSGS